MPIIMTTRRVFLQDMGELSRIWFFCYNHAGREKIKGRVRQMKRRILCFLTAALLAAVLPVSGSACEHYNVTVWTRDLVTKGYVDPQIGVSGYSGDLCCPVCGEVIIPGKQLPPREDPAGVSGGSGKPAEPGNTEQHETPAKPEEPVLPEKPVQPTVQTRKPAQPENREKPEKTVKPKDTAQPKTTARPDKNGKSAGRPSGGNKQVSGAEKRERFSTQFPYRRVKMQPEAGIRAEGAGVLLWPVAVSPFQSLFN